MILLADENIDQSIVARLRLDGHEVLAVAELEPSLSDDRVLTLSGDRQRLLLTADKDFGDLVFRQQRRGVGGWLAEGRETFVMKANKRSGPSPGKSTKRLSVTKPPALTDEATLLSDLRTLIQSARQRIATVANATYTLLCWQVGRRLLKENLQTGRAAYGKQILATLSQELTAEFGAGFSYTALTRMARFAEWMTKESGLAWLDRIRRSVSIGINTT